MNRCFVIQPFDKGPFDARFDEVLKPAIEAAGLEAYRVDRDPGADVPIDKIESEIRKCVVCLADISADNPNVWYEVGFAFASDKPVCLICAGSRAKFPFDIQHRHVIGYSTDCPADFITLQTRVTDRLRHQLSAQLQLRSVNLQGVQISGGLAAHEIAALVSIVSNSLTDAQGVAGYQILRDMDQMGFNATAAGIAIRALAARRMIGSQVVDSRDGEYKAYQATDLGDNWILEHQHELQLKKTPSNGIITEDDIPF